MKHSISLAVIAATMTLTPALAKDSSPGQFPDNITREAAMQRAADRFDSADIDGNGVLTREEMREAFKNMKDHRTDHARGDHPTDHARGAAIFPRLDSDDDGTLSRAEFASGMKRMVKDRERERDERNMSDRHAERASKLFDKLDSNDDGKLSIDEFAHIRNHGSRQHR